MRTMSLFKRLVRNDAGASGVEFTLLAPFLVLLFLGGCTVYDIYRSYRSVVEANNVVADAISRQSSINSAFYNNIYEVFTNLQPDRNAPNAMRITSVRNKSGKFVVEWSKQSGQLLLLKKSEIDAALLPEVSDGDSIIFVEGSVRYNLLTSFIGLEKLVYRGNAFARPRFVAAVAYSQ